MSSTNRGAVRREHDFYSTPEAAFRPLLSHLAPVATEFWEPACGDRRLIKWLREAGHAANGNDLQHGYDFLKDATVRDAIITNPPFSIAQEFCQHAIEHAQEVMMLLRLNFLGSQKRHDWWKRNEPSALYIMSERPDFTGGGGDSTEYAWFIWSPRYTGIHHLRSAAPTVEIE